MTRLSFRALVPILALSVILLGGATSQPGYLQGTQLLPAFRMTFTLHQMNEFPPPNPNQKDEVVYLTAGSTTYFKSIFRQSPLLPGEPVSLDREVEWYVVRDPNFNNQYTARVYCRTCNPKSYVLVAVNFGPPRQDLAARFNAKLDLPPLPAPRPSSHLPVTPPPPNTTPIEWFLTSGTTNKFGQICLAPGGDQGYFAMYAQQGMTNGGVFYKQPYGRAGGGAWHQGYGPIVYDHYEIPPNLTPAMFTPPSDYAPITTPKMPGGEVMVKKNCAVCHMTESGPTTLYASPPPPKPPGH